MPDETVNDDYDEDGEPTTGSGLRAELEKAHRKIRKLEKDSQNKFDAMNQQAMGKAFEDLDLDPTVGIGKAAAITYEGDAAGLAQYVSDEFGHVGGESPLIPLIDAGYARLDAVGQVASAVDPVPSEVEQLAKAEAEGDFETAGALKARQMERMLRR